MRIKIGEFMKQRNKYKNKNVLVLGFAKSGYYVARLLNKLGANVTINDVQDLKHNEEALYLEKKGIKIISGGHPSDLLTAQSFDIIVKNPGIPYSNKILKQASAMQIPIITEVEVAGAVIEGHLIGVSGTNGKTTTTAIVQQMLDTDRNEGQAYAVGNIGIPVSQIALETQVEDDLVIELSSFQLMSTPSIHPEIAVLTNIYSAHLDYHGTQEAYEEAKINLIRNMTEDDTVIYNYDQKHLRELVKQNTKAKLLPFSRKEKVVDGIFVENDYIYYKDEKIIKVGDIFLAGQHNLENMLAAIGVAKIKKVPNEVIKDIAQHFHGVEHRTQFVKKLNERIFYNDSKATNIEATQNALAGFEQPVILLAGGLDRGDDYKELLPLFKKHLKALIVFGETADKIAEVGKQAGVSIIKKVGKVDEAVPVAYSVSDTNDVILLSPASASWDQYKNFEIRGQEYIKAIEELSNN